MVKDSVDYQPSFQAELSVLRPQIFTRSPAARPQPRSFLGAVPFLKASLTFSSLVKVSLLFSFPLGFLLFPPIVHSDQAQCIFPLQGCSASSRRCPLCTPLLTYYYSQNLSALYLCTLICNFADPTVGQATWLCSWVYVQFSSVNLQELPVSSAPFSADEALDSALKQGFPQACYVKGCLSSSKLN